MAEKKSVLPWGLEKGKLTPGSSKAISMNKLKAFNIGTMNVKKVLSKKEQEDQRKKEDEAAAAKVYEEFVQTFEDGGKGTLNRSWVKAGTFNDKDKAGGAFQNTTKMYRPSSKIADAVMARGDENQETNKQNKPAMPGKGKQKEKKKSNLELFKEELARIQEERDERSKIKRAAGIYPDDPARSGRPPTRFQPPPELEPGGRFSQPDDVKNFNYDDMTTTNLYLGNINPRMTEQQMCELFGKHGPLASIKIMYPRSDEEKNRGRNCGFVAFMNRKDGERALSHLQGRDIMGYEMKLGWGKGVAIPPRPIYIPPSMLEMTLPPPPSGLPFNCQPNIRPQPGFDTAKYGRFDPPRGGERNGRQRNGQREEFDMNDPEGFEKTLANAVVKVVIPTDRNLLCVIHRVVEFVIREGPMFEAMIMNRELNNAMFRFLFENQSPAHIYYRWKLFSLLQGDSPYKWRIEEFRMFKGGSIWRPPPMNPFTSGMPADLISVADGGLRKGSLPDDKRDKLEDMLRDLTAQREKVGDAMVWCLEHADSAEEIVECIMESLSIIETPIPKKIARLFLISDILYNSSAKVQNVSYFRKFFEPKLPEIFRDIHACYENIDARLKAEHFKQKVMACFRAWEDWAVYPSEYLIKLQNTFLGLMPKSKGSPVKENNHSELDGAPLAGDPDLDGAPLPDPELDGHRMEDGEPNDVDGMPLAEDIDGMPIRPENKPIENKFKASKWDTVDEKELEAQAMTTSKWDLLEQEEEEKRQKEMGDLDGLPMEDDRDGSHSRSSSPIKLEMTEERRAKLRDIELKVVKYQDELEAGKRTRKAGMTISEQVMYYRRKLQQKEEDKAREKEREKRREDDRVRVREFERAQERARERESGNGNDRSRAQSDSSDDDELNNSHRKKDKRRDKYRNGSSSPSPSPTRHSRHSSKRGSPSPFRVNDSTDSPARNRHRSRSRSPVRKHRSKSPKRSRSGRDKRSRTRSKSPERNSKKQKRKKNKH